MNLSLPNPENVNQTVTDSVILDIISYCGFLIIMTISLVGNGVVLMVFFRHEHLRTKSNTFIGSLAISDIMFGILYTMYNTSQLNSNTLSAVLGDWYTCVTLMTFIIVFQHISSYSLVGLTAMRLFVVSNPLTYKKVLSRWKIMIWLMVVWGGSVIMSAAMYFRLFPVNSLFSEKRLCRFEYAYNVGNIIAHGTTVIAIPIILMLVMYIRMVIIIRTKLMPMPLVASHLSIRNDICLPQMQHSSAKALKTTSLLVGYFTLAWTPVLTYTIINITCRECTENFKADPWIRVISRLLCHSNTAVNVFIYAGRMSDFRLALISDIRRFSTSWCMKQ